MTSYKAYINKVGVVGHKYMERVEGFRKARKLASVAKYVCDHNAESSSNSTSCHHLIRESNGVFGASGGDNV